MACYSEVMLVNVFFLRGPTHAAHDEYRRNVYTNGGVCGKRAREFHVLERYCVLYALIRINQQLFLPQHIPTQSSLVICAPACVFKACVATKGPFVRIILLLLLVRERTTTTIIMSKCGRELYNYNYTP